MASFQAKIVWKRPRKREYKNYSFVPSIHDAQLKISKNSKKNSKKFKTIIMAPFQATIG